MAKINLLIGIFFIITILSVAGITYFWPDGNVHIIFCDVGQGDAILIQHQFTQVLIDAGPDDTVLSCLDKHIPIWDRTLEMVVATHPDLDHIGGFESVFNRFLIKNVLLEPLVKDTDFFNHFHQLLLEEKKKGASIFFPTVGDSFTFNGVMDFLVLSPQEDLGDEQQFLSASTETLLSDNNDESNESEISYNDLSIVLFLRINMVIINLTGDLEANGELALLKYGLTTKTDVLKVGHHGSKTSSTDLFLDTTRPEISVISSGKNNKYNHPDPLILERISHFSRKIIRTDQVGTIEIVTDGRKYWLSESSLEE